MKKIYEAPAVEMTKFNGEDTMTVFKSGAINVTSSLVDTKVDLSQDF